MILVFGVLLRLSVLEAKTESHDTQIKSGTLFVIKVDWPGTSGDDVDTYVADPDRHLVYFRRLQDGLMNLERDDTGLQSNTVKLPDGTAVVSAFNEEVVDIRGIIPGEYIVNVQMYRKSNSDPTDVGISLYKVAGGRLIKAHDEAVTLKEKGDEVTAFRFTLTKDGDVLDINRLPKRFLGVPGGV
jgi:hypothetical protein